MGNFNLKNIWAPKTGGGGSIPSNLEQRVQELENNTLKLNNNKQLQIVHHGVDFYETIICKKEAFVDVVGNGPTNITNKQYVDTKDAQNVKITGDQSIAGVKTFTGTGEVIKLNSGRDDSAYMVGYKSNNRRIWYFGKGSSSDDNFVIGSTANIKLEATSAIQCNNKRITQVADPTADTDAATKQYVDNRIKTRTLTQTINTNSSFTVAPTQGYQLINVMIGRKRTSDNYFFFSYHETLNFQFYVNSSNNFIIWNQGNVNGFNNEYKIIIAEMKV